MKRYIALKTIVELGSFSRAAEALGYTQSAMSQMISALEGELSIKLVNRFRTGTELTPEGRELYPQIERLVCQYRAVQEKAGEIRGLESGVVRMGTIASVSAHWLPGLIREFQRAHPGIEFVMHQGDYTSIQAWIKSGRIDFGFINPSAAAGIQTCILKEGAMLAALPVAHPLAELDAVPLERLAREPFILLEEGCYSEPLEAFRAIGCQPNVKYTIHDDYSIMSMIEAGLGVSILAELILRRCGYRLALRPTDPPVRRTLAVGYRRREDLPMAAKRFLELLEARAAQLP